MFRFPVKKKKKKADTHPLSLFAFEWVCFRPGLYPPGMKNKLWENTVKKPLSFFFFPYGCLYVNYYYNFAFIALNCYIASTSNY